MEKRRPAASLPPSSRFTWRSPVALISQIDPPTASCDAQEFSINSTQHFKLKTERRPYWCSRLKSDSFPQSIVSTFPGDSITCKNSSEGTRKKNNSKRFQFPPTFSDETSRVSVQPARAIVSDFFSASGQQIPSHWLRNQSKISAGDPFNAIKHPPPLTSNRFTFSFFNVQHSSFESESDDCGL